MQFMKHSNKMEFYEINICGDCGGIVNERSMGDEGWSVCSECGTVEGNNTMMYECPQCGQLKDEPECDRKHWTVNFNNFIKRLWTN